ncbi:hypothetical protein FRAHR75_1310009 [Frankia sp. Hr75.2]|nr:hypothetical protein FRAHR75_1310009 [Frankia sp. Hr75.2]
MAALTTTSGPVVEVLSAFVREHTRQPADNSPRMARPLTDVQAALTVLGGRPEYGRKPP